MRVLVVDGFGPGEGSEVVDPICLVLGTGGHDVVRTKLADEGFDRFMSGDERAAYHSDQPLVCPETRAAADAVARADALVLCYPLIHGTCPPRVKSWQERVFVLGVGFHFTRSGRITGALQHLRRACVVAVAPEPDRLAGRRNGQGRCLARSFHLSANRRCRSWYLMVAPGQQRPVERLLHRW